MKNKVIDRNDIQTNFINNDVIFSIFYVYGKKIINENIFFKWCTVNKYVCQIKYNTIAL